MKFGLPKKLKIPHLAAALASGILLILLSNTFTHKEKSEPPLPAMENTLENCDTEKKLAQMLGSIEGVSDVQVLITYENNGVKKVTSFGEQALIQDGAKKTDTIKNTPVTAKNSSGESPFVDEEILPEIRGVLIVAKGLEKRALACEITEAVSAALGVSVNRVKTLPAS